MRANQRSLILFSLLAAVLSPAAASVAYVSDCCNNSSIVGVFQTSNNALKAHWTVGQNAFQAVYSVDGTKVYVSNTNSQSVSVLSAETGATLATVPVGYQVQWEVVSPNGALLYVESFDVANVYHIVAIDTATNTVNAVLEIPDYFVDAMTLSPDGATIYVAGLQGLYVINANPLAISTIVAFPNGASQSITPDGKYLYIAQLGTPGNTQETVQVVSTSTYAAVQSIPLQANVSAGFIQITPDGSQAWIGEFPLYNGYPNIIVEISTSTYQTTTITLPANQSAGAIVFSPDSTKAYVPVNGPDIAVMSVATGKLVGIINSIGGVGGVAISPDGSTLLSPSSGTADLVAISGISASTPARVPIGAMDYGNQLYLQYGAVAVSPDAKRVYATDYASDSVAVIATASKKVIYSAPVGATPVGVVVSPDSSKVYAVNSYSDSVTAIDAQTFKSTTIAIPEANQGYPSAIAISPDGATVYVAVDNPQPDFGTAACWIVGIDTGTNQVTSATRIYYPMAFAVSPDGSAIYVIGGNGDDTLYTISTQTHQVTHAVGLALGIPEQPVSGGIAVTADGTTVFATDGNSPAIFEVNTGTNKLIKKISAGVSPGSLAITADGSELWATDLVGTSVLVVDIASATLVRTIPIGNQSYGIAFGPE